MTPQSTPAVSRPAQALKPRHKIFIREIFQHGDKLKAYQTAYPHATGENARTAAHRLYNKPHIKAIIEPRLQRARDLALQEWEDEAKERIKAEVKKAQLDKERKREVLAQIVNGEWGHKRNIRLGERVQIVYDGPNAHQVIRAIEVDNRIEAGYDYGARTPKLLQKAMKEAEEQEWDPNKRPGDKDTTACIIMIGNRTFDTEGIHERWLERYAAWKAENPGKVREWVEEAAPGRIDTWIVWDEDSEALSGGWVKPEERQGNRSVVQIIRFADGSPYEAFIPGVSKLIKNNNEVAEGSGSAQEEPVAESSGSAQVRNSSNPNSNSTVIPLQNRTSREHAHSQIENTTHSNSKSQIPNSNSAQSQIANQKSQLNDPWHILITHDKLFLQRWQHMLERKEKQFRSLPLKTQWSLARMAYQSHLSR